MDAAELKKMREERLKDLEAIDRVLAMTFNGAKEKKQLPVEVVAEEENPSETPNTRFNRVKTIVMNNGKNFNIKEIIDLASKKDPELTRNDIRIALWTMGTRGIITMIEKNRGRQMATYRIN